MLIVFDAECDFCVSSLKWVKRLDWFKKFNHTPYQSDELYKHYPQLNTQACAQALHLVLNNRKVLVGGDAVRHILLNLPLTFLGGAVLSLPGIRHCFNKKYIKIALNRKCTHINNVSR
jgi:predicted DCC family thiol-disulfide oxidoreductase YuxK